MGNIGDDHSADYIASILAGVGLSWIPADTVQAQLGPIGQF